LFFEFMALRSQVRLAGNLISREFRYKIGPFPMAHAMATH
jgi:hypothetical protein